MRKWIVLIIIFFIAGTVSAQVTVSGILDTTVTYQAGAGDSPDHSFGFEEFANLRLQSKLRDRGAVYGALNLIAASGDYATNAARIEAYNTGSSLSFTSYTAGENYIAAIELERLYFRLNGEHIDFDGGLFRLPFGFGHMWGSSDFLNPKNPLKPDARPRAILGTAIFWYPTDEMKFLSFYSTPRDPFSREGNGSIFGISMDYHWDKASIQTLYSFETPKVLSNYGIHRAGLSLKADIEIGLVIDALYTYNYQADTELDGLSCSLGIDYSFFDSKVIVLSEYLFNGKTSSTALGYGGSFSNNHYLYTGFTFRFSDFTNMTTAVINCLDDVSFTPIVSLNHELFQGAALTITAQFPIDRDVINGGKRGELGPLPPDELQPFLPMRMGRYFNCSAKLRLRF